MIIKPELKMKNASDHSDALFYEKLKVNQLLIIEKRQNSG